MLASTSQTIFAIFLFFWTFPLKRLFHYIIGPRNKYVPLDMMLIFMFHCGLAGKHLYLRPQNRRRSPPPKAADFFGCYFVFCTDVFLQVHNETCRSASYLMEHIYFEAQLCSQIATLKEKTKQHLNLKICETSFDWWS